MRYLMVFALLVIVGCQFFSQPAYMDADGVLHQATSGVIDDIISGLTVASPFIPYLGAVVAGLSVVGGVGTYATGKKNRKDDAKITAKLIDQIKKDVGNLANDKHVTELVNTHIPKDKGYGKLLHSVYKELKEQGEID